MVPDLEEKRPITQHRTTTQCDKSCVLSCAVQGHFKGAVEDGGLPQSC